MENDLEEISLKECPPELLHLSVQPGLNIKVICENQQCSSRKNGQQGEVWLHCSYSTIVMNAIIYGTTCRMCDQEIHHDNFRNVGYWLCRINFEGVQLLDGGKKKIVKLEDSE